MDGGSGVQQPGGALCIHAAKRIKLDFFLISLSFSEIHATAFGFRWELLGVINLKIVRKAALRNG